LIGKRRVCGGRSCGVAEGSVGAVAREALWELFLNHAFLIHLAGSRKKRARSLVAGKAPHTSQP
jgi:hypothetical protein